MILKQDKKEKKLLYFQNSEIAKMMAVSSMTIGRYIRDSQNNTNELTLIKINNKYKIEKTDENIETILRLTGQKCNFKNNKKYKQILPKKSFYSTFNENAQHDIIRCLYNRLNITAKYLYYGDGADKFMMYRNSLESVSKMESCLEGQLNYLIKHGIENNIIYNIVEFLPTEMKTSMSFLKKLNANNLINKYYALEVGQQILELNKNIFVSNFPTNMYNGSVIDLSSTSINSAINNIRYNHLANNDGKKEVLVVLALGCIFSNFSNISKRLEMLKACLDEGDILCFDFIYKDPTLTSNTTYNKESLDFSFFSHTLSEVGFNKNEISMYNDFNSKTNTNHVIVELKDNYCINFECQSGNIPIMLPKGLKIQTIVHKMTNIVDLLEISINKGFSPINISSSEDSKFVNFLLRKNKINITSFLDLANHNRVLK